MALEVDEPLLLLAERVAREAASLGIETVLIGAMAMAVFGHVRVTYDVDLASCVDPFTKLVGE